MTSPVWDGDGRDPWLPERLQARLEVTQVERDIRAAVWSALSDWLVQLARRVLRSDERPDMDAVWAMAPAWREAVDLILQGEIFKAIELGFSRVLPGYPFDQRSAVTRYLAEVRNRMVRLPEEVFDLVAGQMSAGVNMGESIPQLAARVDDVLSTTASERWPNRAVVTARTEAIGALNMGRWESFNVIAEDDPETSYQKLWLSTEDTRTRPTHVEADQQRVPLAGRFNVGGFELAFPGDPTGPAKEVIQCVIGSTEVAWPRQRIQGSTSRSHPGPFVQIITAEGHDLTVTPNHPVLTPTGYVPAGLLRPGQHVLGTGDAKSPEVDHVPASAEQVHRALRKTGKSERVMGGRMDFHGDGADGEVEVVGANRYLPVELHPEGKSEIMEEDLVGPGNRERPLSGLSGAVVLGLPAPRDAGETVFAGCLVSRKGQLPALGGAHTRKAEPVSLTGFSDRQAKVSEAPDDGRTADADFPAHLQYALAAGMTPCEVVQVNRLAGERHVYNLSTSDHWYSANGIAVHNCRCTLLLVEEGEVVNLSRRQMPS